MRDLRLESQRLLPCDIMEDKSVRIFGFVTYSACILVPALALLVAVARLHAYWDDGAITAAFARTFQQSGFLALTPVSEHVEGTSSLLWMLVLSAGSKFLHSPNSLLCWSKIAAALAFSSTLFLFSVLAGHFFKPLFAHLATLLLALTETPFVETLNGMEMCFYALLVVALALTLIRTYSRNQRHPSLHWALAAAISNAVLLVRFEAPMVLFFLYLGIWLRFRRPKALLAVAATNLAFMAMVEIWRFQHFHSWVPNTVLAKRWTPYSPSDMQGRLLSRMDATSELFTVLLVPIYLCSALWLVAKLKRPSGKEAGTLQIDPILASMSAGAILLGFVVGKNWGHSGRMILAFIPFVILLLLLVVQQLISALHLDATRIVLFIAISQAVLWIYQTRFAVEANSVSYSMVERVGLAAESVRVLLNRPTISAFVPDVGASSLCCEHLQIMDSALLANSALAKQGYQGVPAFLAHNQPDLIETHGSWAADGGLYTQHLLDAYGLIKVRGEYMFLRADLYRELQHGKGTHVQASCLGMNDAANMRPKDAFFLETRTECISVDGR